MTVTTENLLKQNLASIHTEMESACLRCGRSIVDVGLVAVTKYAEWEWVRCLSELHQTFGENRPQQLAERQVLLPGIGWHLIGQLQRNKVKLALQHATMIHSIDSLRLLERVAQVAADLQLRPRVLIQVNLSGESSKSGLDEEQLRHEWPRIVDYAAAVQIDGFMTMAAESDDPEDARPVFRSLRTLRDELQQTDASRNAGLELRHLSMGMSGDFVPAIEEGATMIRIGSRIFAGLS
ncbi:MAG TPA: YggS family pyridoxal phosphate-dependent enzyme [Planctomycetaceae bacterium]|nr:YggS family pyridoxal phosphate-dependent enzyme [Planctomycetaceae bacterium]HRA88576.1 YggS family pyridoxal phosphate-dependent enzyme [Planctomycetaceae bacterium]